MEFNPVSCASVSFTGKHNRRKIVSHFRSFILTTSLVLACTAFAARNSIAGPAEQANAALDQFSAAYSANDVDALVQLYTPNAIVLGTNSPIISEGADAVRAYFTGIKLGGSGNNNQVQERRTIIINDNAVIITGFYEFTRMSEGKPVPDPARF